MKVHDLNDVCRAFLIGPFKHVRYSIQLQIVGLFIGPSYSVLILVTNVRSAFRALGRAPHNASSSHYNFYKIWTRVGGNMNHQVGPFTKARIYLQRKLRIQ